MQSATRKASRWRPGAQPVVPVMFSQRAYLLVSLAVSVALSFRGGISWEAHLGGLIGGAAITAAIVYAPRTPRRTTVQAAGALLVVAVAVAVISGRALVLA